MKPVWIVVAVLCCVASFFLGRSNPAPSEPAELAADSGARQGASKEPDLSTATGKLALAQRALLTEKTSHQETAVALEEARRKLAAARQAEAAQPAVESDDEQAKRPRFTFPAVAKVLEGINWKDTGQAIRKMGPLLTEFAESLAAGKGLPSSIGELQRWNGPLLAMALKAQQEGVPGTGIPGAFSHPSITVNMVHAALLDGGAPLDESQTENLARIGDRFVAEDERRLAAYREDTFQLQKEIEEAALKDRLYVEVDAILSEPQRDLLHPPPVRGRMGLDLFSSGVLWNALCAPIKFADQEALRKSLTDLVVQRTQIPVESRAVVEGLVVDWVAGFPAAFLEEEPDALYRAALSLPGNTGTPVRRGRLAAEHQLRFLRALHDRFSADSDLAARVRGAPVVALPVLWTTKPN